MITTTSPEPSLAAPGAGLPAAELVIARLLFSIRRLTGSRASFTQKFLHERATVHALLSHCPADYARRRVLIPRPRGLEDSSRYWSVWMTLDHLRIVHDSMARVIAELIRGQRPAGTANTAAVKPSAQVDASVLAAYELSCDRLLAAAAQPDLRTPLRYAHPWFGSLDALGWYALAGTHLGIHRVQIEQILQAQP